MAAVLAATLGLAPFSPEPHVVGKIRWLCGGGEGMKVMDYFDLLFHGSTWIYLIVLVLFKLIVKIKESR